MDDRPPPYPGDTQDGYARQPPPGYSAVPQQPVQGYYPQQPVQTYPYSQPPQAYPPQPTTTTHTVTVAPVHQTIIGELGPSPTSITCPQCQRHIITLVDSQPNYMAWILCFILFILGLWVCCLVPFCLDYFHDVTHRCPNCRYIISSHRR
ncbi:cell death-inducing p53-target protein 1 homolog isoform X2 [Ptychodera flava]|uniref:cell death-inducing p53-target protein 1 homolog isoform X2 n=1 Tax=Ptychodera flava TaxID=63121 RepID=UPI003969FEF5